MRTRSVAKVLAVWGAVGLLTLTACGGDESPRTLDLDGGSSGAVAPESSKESTPEAPDEPREGELTRGANAASTPQEKEVAEVWFTYLEEFVRVLGTPDPLGLKLSDIATGPALHDPLAYAGDLAKDDLRLGGGMIATLLEVEVTKGKAVVRGCIHSSMLKVDATDKPVVAMEDPWIDSEHRLVARGNEWFVAEHELDGAPKCV